MSALIKAIIATAEEIGPLVKDQYNQHSGYSFAGIDTFYERVAPVARRHGLVWTISEYQPPTLIEGSKNPVVIFHFEVALRAISEPVDTGEGYTSTWESIPMRISVPHNWAGAQTAGSASSYAIKSILRAVLAVQTGELDADAEQQNFAPGAPPAPRPKTAGVSPAPAPAGSPTAGPAPVADTPPATGAPLTMEDIAPIFKEWYEGNLPVMVDPGGDPAYPWDLARDIFLDNISYITDAKRLTGWWRANITVMEQMKVADPATHKVVVEAFEKCRNNLVKK